MIQITSITLREIALPLREPFAISSGTESTRRIALLEVGDAEGVVAWSECVAGAAPNYSPETIDTAWLAIREWLAPLVLGVTFPDPPTLARALDANVRGHRMAKGAIEMASWLLLALLRGQSLAEVIGGTRGRIPVGISLGIQESPAALVAKARAALEEGYRKVKIKISPGRDVDFLRAAREALGPGAPLMADANNAYTLADVPTLRALDDLGLMMIEQPLAWDDVVEHATLQRELRTPICLDESITDVTKARAMVALQSGRIVNIKPGRVGGFTESLAIHDYCVAEDIPVWCGGMLESGIGRAYNVALASLPGFTMPGDVSPSARYWERDIVTPEWTMDPDGFVIVPRERPGLGVEIDRDRVEALTVRHEVLSHA